MGILFFDAFRKCRLQFINCLRVIRVLGAFFRHIHASRRVDSLSARERGRRRRTGETMRASTSGYRFMHAMILMSIVIVLAVLVRVDAVPRKDMHFSREDTRRQLQQTTETGCETDCWYERRCFFCRRRRVCETICPPPPSPPPPSPPSPSPPLPSPPPPTLIKPTQPPSA